MKTCFNALVSSLFHSGFGNLRFPLFCLFICARISSNSSYDSGHVLLSSLSNKYHPLPPLLISRKGSTEVPYFMLKNAICMALFFLARMSMWFELMILVPLLLQFFILVLEGGNNPVMHSNLCFFDIIIFCTSFLLLYFFFGLDNIKYNCFKTRSCK